MRICVIALLLAAPLRAATILYDFETDEQIRTWRIRSAAQDTFESTPQFATSGKRSAAFRSPKWTTGMEAWPAFEVKPAQRDWSHSSTLLIDLVNPTTQYQVLSLFISDSDTPFRQGFQQTWTMAPKAHLRAEIDLGRLPGHVDRNDIAILHFFMTRPEHEFVVHLDQITLLIDGESAPAIPNSFQADVQAMLAGPDVIGPIKAALADAREHIGKLPIDSPARAALADNLKAISAAPLHWLRTPQQAARIVALATRSGTDDVIVGTASAAQKVLPRDVPPEFAVTSSIAMALARNETESVQVVVVPLAASLADVHVTVEPIDGVAVDMRVVGYVKTDHPPYPVSHVGWWPDPLLDFMSATDIACGDAQALWVRYRASKDAAPGTRKSCMHVRTGDRTLRTFDVDVRVFDFAVPDASPLPTAMSFYDNFASKLAGDAWNDALKQQWADFLADYYIDYDNIYLNSAAPDWDILKRLNDQGRLVAFNLRYYGHHKVDEADDVVDGYIANLTTEMRAAYSRAKELGIADKAYIYGFDERRPDHFPQLQRVVAAIKQALPDVPVMTTTFDQSFGQNTVVKAIDIWTPLTPRYDAARAAEARRAGKQVWWYICVGPRHPFANWFVEYPAIEARLLMGAMTAKYRPDGFLYYAISRFPNNDKPITTGPFTEWNPASFGPNNGDGSLLCSGPGGKPLATIRLENFRDGLEDYAYVKQLEALDPDHPALAVPADVVRSMTDFTHDPAALYRWRNAVAEAITQSRSSGNR